MKDFKWNRAREIAARMVAEDDVTDEQIAKSVKIAWRTLQDWKTVPEFQARVQSHLAAFRKAEEELGIASRANRVAAQNARWLALQQIVDERAVADDMEKVPGGKTGLIVHNVKGVGKGEDFQLIDLYEVDGGLLDALRKLEQHTAMELGQWTEKREISGPDGGPLKAIVEVSLDDL